MNRSIRHNKEPFIARSQQGASISLLPWCTLTRQLKASLGSPFHSYLPFCTWARCSFWTWRTRGRGERSALTWFEAAWPLRTTGWCQQALWSREATWGVSSRRKQEKTLQVFTVRLEVRCFWNSIAIYTVFFLKLLWNKVSLSGK